MKDTRLSDAQRNNELLKLDLARQREQSRLRINAAQEKLATADKLAAAAQTKLDTIASVVSGTVGSVLGGGGISGPQIGQNVGTLASAFFPVLGPFAAGVGGLIGGLFDKNDKQAEQAQQPVISGLDAIERAVRETHDH